MSQIDQRVNFTLRHVGEVGVGCPHAENRQQTHSSTQDLRADRASREAMGMAAMID
jgi:hypothetical protein